MSWLAFMTNNAVIEERWKMEERKKIK